MARKPKPAADDGSAATTETVPAAQNNRAAAESVAHQRPGWSIEVSTRRGRTQTRYRAGRAFGPEAVTIAVDDLTPEQLAAIHDDAELVVSVIDDDANEEEQA